MGNEHESIAHAHHTATDRRVCDVDADLSIVLCAESEVGGIDAINCNDCLVRMAQAYEKIGEAIRARIKRGPPTCAMMPVMGNYRGGGVPPGEWIEVATDDPRLPRRSHRVQRLVVSKECADWRIDKLEIDGEDLLCGLVLYGRDFSGKSGGEGDDDSFEYGEDFVFLIRATNMTDKTAPLLACWVVDPDPEAARTEIIGHG